MMTTSQQLALVSLLQDGDAATIGMVKDQLLEGGTQRVPEYHELLQLAKGSARASIKEVIDQIENSQTLGDISRGLADLRTLQQLEELCWDFARSEQPDFRGAPYARVLDQWAQEAGKLIRPNATAREKVNCLAHYLGRVQGLTGNSGDYYHPRNGYLPWVIEFRSGLPITVSLVYMLVGMRLGIPVEGIGAPGHFLARLDDVIFDPYYKGRILTEGEWEMIASEIPERQRPFLSKACTPLETMHRLLINVRNCYVKRNDVERRRRVDSYLAVLQR
jgi:regulator of sirC expression with transglutaminase-like and TPR domain